MRAADQATIAGGLDGYDLMQRAGQACVTWMLRHCVRQAVLVLAGPGNNGGDGLVIARLLHDRGWPVRLALFAEADALRGEAARAFADLPFAADAADTFTAPTEGLVIDAVFGTGLTRPLPDAVQTAFDGIAAAGLPVIAIDIPSGIAGDSGEELGRALTAAHTLTFQRLKPGHLLVPGRYRCGQVHRPDIGIQPEAWSHEPRPIARNDPHLWRDQLPRLAGDSHKYQRGMALMAGSGTMPGASLLAAQAARRSGAGHVALALPESVAAQAAIAHPGLVVRPLRSAAGFRDLLADGRLSAVLIGPGLSTGSSAATLLTLGLEVRVPLVLDADALTLLAQQGDVRFQGRAAVLTPHEGEFRRLCPDLAGDQDLSKLDKALTAAERLGAVVVLKGPDTVVASPDGQAVINTNAPPTLATAGTGDVLAGTITGLMAQGMASFAAAAAGVWINGAAATVHGPGLIAEDLPALLPGCIARAVQAA